MSTKSLCRKSLVTLKDYINIDTLVWRICTHCAWSALMISHELYPLYLKTTLHVVYLLYLKTSCYWKNHARCSWKPLWCMNNADCFDSNSQCDIRWTMHSWWYWKNHTSCAWIQVYFLEKLTHCTVKTPIICSGGQSYSYKVIPLRN